MSQPFFSIGVTTYNRNELLQQALSSILAQTFTDFEVIVGNDFTEKNLSCENLGINDQRIRIVNHHCNLKETGNMNALLAMASGRYFTWLADDDLYQPDFLKMAHELLVGNDFPPALFSSYSVFQGNSAPRTGSNCYGAVTSLTGYEFLNRYFNDGIKLIGVYGLFETNQLRNIVGGVEDLCESEIGVYGEYIFIVRSALLQRIVYTDAPMILYRGHAGSWSVSNVELEKYVKAGQELVQRSARVLSHPLLSDCLTTTLLGLCRIHLTGFAGKCALIEIVGKRIGIDSLARSLSRYIVELENVYSCFLSEGGQSCLRTSLSFVWLRLKGSYIIFCMLAYNWLKRAARIDGYRLGPN